MNFIGSFRGSCSTTRRRPQYTYSHPSMRQKRCSGHAAPVPFGFFPALAPRPFPSAASALPPRPFPSAASAASGSWSLSPSGAVLFCSASYFASAVARMRSMTGVSSV